MANLVVGVGQPQVEEVSDRCVLAGRVEVAGHDHLPGVRGYPACDVCVLDAPPRDAGTIPRRSGVDVEQLEPGLMDLDQGRGHTQAALPGGLGFDQPVSAVNGRAVEPIECIDDAMGVVARHLERIDFAGCGWCQLLHQDQVGVGIGQ